MPLGECLQKGWHIHTKTVAGILFSALEVKLKSLKNSEAAQKLIEF